MHIILFNVQIFRIKEYFLQYLYEKYKRGGKNKNYFLKKIMIAF